MKKYLVDISDEVELEVEAESPEKALFEAINQYPSEILDMPSEEFPWVVADETGNSVLEVTDPEYAQRAFHEYLEPVFRKL